MPASSPKRYRCSWQVGKEQVIYSPIVRDVAWYVDQIGLVKLGPMPLRPPDRQSYCCDCQCVNGHVVYLTWSTHSLFLSDKAFRHGGCHLPHWIAPLDHSRSLKFLIIAQ